MSKGSARRKGANDAAFKANAEARGWPPESPNVRRMDAAVSALLAMTATPACEQLTSRNVVRGCAPLAPVGLVKSDAPVTIDPDAT